MVYRENSGRPFKRGRADPWTQHNFPQEGGFRYYTYPTRCQVVAVVQLTVRLIPAHSSFISHQFDAAGLKGNKS